MIGWLVLRILAITSLQIVLIRVAAYKNLLRVAAYKLGLEERNRCRNRKLEVPF